MTATPGRESASVAVVVLPGFEPGQTEPKPVVLPLHHKTDTVPRAKPKSDAKLITFFLLAKSK